MKKNLITDGEPCRPFKIIRFYTKEEIKKMIPLMYNDSYHVVTEHEYYDRMIKNNELIENYEECHRLMELKRNTPHTKELKTTWVF
jgi:hypothetical protein